MGSSGRRLYVGGVPEEASQKDLHDLFYQLGDLVEVRMLQGYAFVEYDLLRDAERAVRDYHHYDFKGGRLIVDFARPPRSAQDRRDSGYGGGGGGRYSGSGGDDRVFRGGGRDCGSRDEGYESSSRREYGSSSSRSYRGDYYTSYPSGGGRSGNPRGYRVKVSNLPRGCSWQDLKDFGRAVGTVTFAEVDRNDSGTGYLEYGAPKAAADAVSQLDRCKLHGETLRLYSEDDDPPRSTYGDRERESGHSSRSSRDNGYSTAATSYGTPYKEDKQGEDKYNYDDYGAGPSAPRARSKSPVADRRADERGRSNSPVRYAAEDGW